MYSLILHTKPSIAMNLFAKNEGYTITTLNENLNPKQMEASPAIFSGDIFFTIEVNNVKEVLRTHPWLRILDFFTSSSTGIPYS